MSKINNGGPAFPLLKPKIGYHADIQQADEGVSLRDYFAAKALPQIQFSLYGACDPDEIAMQAYQQADAMIRARGEA